MKLNFKYRETNYFNTEDVFVFFYSPNKQVFTSKVHFHKGNWFTNQKLHYNATTIKSTRLKYVKV